MLTFEQWSVIAGLSIAAGFWIATQVNIWIARKEVKKSRALIQAAIIDINAKIDAKFEDMPEAEDYSIEAVRNEILSKVEDLGANLPQAISSSVRAQILELKGEQTKQFQAMMVESGVMEAAEAEVEHYKGQLSPMAQAALDVGSIKISKKFERDSPVLAILGRNLQALSAQQLLAMSPEGQQLGQSLNTTSNISSDTVYRPGVKR